MTSLPAARSGELAHGAGRDLAPGARPRLLPVGDQAILVELPDAATRRALDAALRERPLGPLVTEHVPAATTVLVRYEEPAVAQYVADGLRSLLERIDPSDRPTTGDVLTVPVRYDGPDLSSLAADLGTTPEALVAWHTRTPWLVDFAGFLPGWGYLVREGEERVIPRLATPRTRVPAGSVALAGSWSGIYPQESPGGWQLVGTCSLTLWDATRPDPALLVPGRLVQFVEQS